MQKYICQVQHNSSSRHSVTAPSPAEAVAQYCDRFRPADGEIIVCRHQDTGDTTTYGVRQVISYTVAEV